MIWTGVYCLAAALLIYTSWRSYRGGLAYLAYFRGQLSNPPPPASLRATVIAPYKGIDEGMDRHLRSLLAQDHADYEVIFVTDSEDDPAVPAIREAIGSSRVPATLVISLPTSESSRKVESLREAVLHAGPDSAVFAFIDSDVHPHATWLRSLTAPLADPAVGAATGYRWYLIEGSAGPATALRSVWNASIASVFGPDAAKNHCWGGSMAIRRDTFERLRVRDRWHGTLSDDLALTRMLREERLPIVFVPAAVVASRGRCSFGQLLEFTTRQMKITRVYAPDAWAASLAGSVLYVGVMLASIILLAVMPMTSFVWSIAVLTLAVVLILGTAKAWLRCRAIRLAMPGTGPELAYHLLLWTVTPLLFLINTAAAWASRRIKWRGLEYEMVSPTETRVIRRND